MSGRSIILAQMTIGGNHTQGHQHNSQSSGAQQSSFRPPAPRGRRGEASAKDMVISPGDYSTYFVGKIRDTRQGRAKSQSRNRRKSLKPKHDRTRRSRSCILLHAILRIFRSMWAINSLRLLLLRRVTPKPLGLSFHHRHHWRLPWFITNSQKGIVRLSNSGTFGRSLKLAQSTTLCLSRGISTEASLAFRPKSALIQCIFTLFVFIFSSKKTIQEGLTFGLM
jgi:hypothetical protein